MIVLWILGAIGFGYTCYAAGRVNGAEMVIAAYEEELRHHEQ